MMAPQQLDPLVSRIALYPDPLLAQILTASTFWPEIPDAANWSNQHAGLTGDLLANAIRQDNLPWDPSVLALLPFPQVLQMMVQDPGWTQTLGDAVLAQRPGVMDAVQRMRQQAYSYGYLRPTPYDTVVNTGGYIEIQPVNPALPLRSYLQPGGGFCSASTRGHGRSLHSLCPHSIYRAGVRVLWLGEAGLCLGNARYYHRRKSLGSHLG